MTQTRIPPERQPRRWPWVLLGMLLALLTWKLWPAGRVGTSHWFPPPVADGGVRSRVSPARPSTGAPAEAVADAPPAAALRPFVGRVVSAWNGAPVAGAEVTFAAPEGASSVTSGPDGRFR